MRVPSGNWEDQYMKQGDFLVGADAGGEEAAGAAEAAATALLGTNSAALGLNGVDEAAEAEDDAADGAGEGAVGGAGVVGPAAGCGGAAEGTLAVKVWSMEGLCPGAPVRGSGGAARLAWWRAGEAMTVMPLGTGRAAKKLTKPRLRGS